MFKKFLILLIFIFFQNSNLYSSEFRYQVFGLNINFLKLKINIDKKKIYSIIVSEGLTGYFVNFKNIIQTSFDKKNNLNYYFNLQKNNEVKIYQFKKINNKINLKNVKLNKGKDYKNIKKKNLSRVVDPLSAAKLILFSNNLNSKCNIDQDIYDGDDVFNIYLTKKSKNYLFINYKNNRYKILFSCRLRYKAVAGHKIKREKKLNSRYLDVYFAKVNGKIIPVYFETKLKLIPLKMYLSTVLKP